MTRDEYIELIEQRYFGNLTICQPKRSVELFAPDGVLTARFPGVAERVARHQPGPGEETLVHFFSAVLEIFRVSYRDFWHSIDEGAQRASCTYTLRLDPLDTTAEGRELRNANFFQFRDGLIEQVLVVGVASAATSPLG